MKRPTFFISSTIYDFYDLRSAIKFYLEDQGCSVLASEYNDFSKPLDMHSYNACLDTIHKADYFILLVGTRVGGWYDKENKISITQREYREALQLSIKGRLKIINFVRSDVWDLRDNRKELGDYLVNIDIDTALKHDIKNYSSKKASDPDFIIKFINEICQIDNTKKAIKNKRQLPKGNWVHIFSSFRDIYDVIQPLVFDGVPIEDAVIKRLLHNEIREIFKDALVKTSKGKIYSPTDVIKSFYDQNEILQPTPPIETHVTKVTAQSWDPLCFFGVHLMGFKPNPLILPKVLTSSVFMEYDNKNGIFKENTIHSAIQLLWNEIVSLNKNNTIEALKVIYTYLPKERPKNLKILTFKSSELFCFLFLLIRWSNIINLIKSILFHLEGGTFKLPNLFPFSPVPGLSEKWSKTELTDKDIEDILKYSVE